MTPESSGLEGASLFEPQPRGTTFDRGVVQALEIFAAGQKEGGFFIMIGRKPGEPKITTKQEHLAAAGS